MNVIYVYLIFRKKGYAFGSLSAVFDYLTEDDVSRKLPCFTGQANCH